VLQPNGAIHVVDKVLLPKEADRQKGAVTERHLQRPPLRAAIRRLA